MRKRDLIIFLLVLFPSLLVAQVDKTVKIYVNFSQTVEAAVQVAPLKYNKSFAYSFTFDDGLDDAYTLGFKLLNGGYSSVDGVQYPGLFYTDGCGNQIPFKAGVAWYTINQYYQDLHIDIPGYMGYSDAIEMNNAGWDFYNHSYDHSANVAGINYAWQIQNNHQAFKNNTGIDFRYLVPPAGDSNYIAPAFNDGMLAVFSSNYSASSHGNSYVDVRKINELERPVFWRAGLSTDQYSLSQLKSFFDAWVEAAWEVGPIWWNDFTHRVQYEETGGSLRFEDFRRYMEYIEKYHGVKGVDNCWMTGSGEVYDYILTRDNLIISTENKGDWIEITMDYSRVPENLRFYNISLILETVGAVTSISSTDEGRVTFAPNDGGYLVNIDFPDSKFSGISDTKLSAKQNLHVYPNPTSGRFTIDMGEMASGQKTCLIMSPASGKVVMEIPYRSEFEQTIDLNKYHLSSGFYIIQVKDENELIRTSKLLYLPTHTP